jgi:hypothetical protein
MSYENGASAKSTEDSRSADGAVPSAGSPTSAP